LTLLRGDLLFAARRHDISYNVLSSLFLSNLNANERNTNYESVFYILMSALRLKSKRKFIKSKSKYRGSLFFYLDGKCAKIFRSYNNSSAQQQWEYVPLTLKYRKRLYVLDPTELPTKIRWIDTTSLSLPPWLRKNQTSTLLHRSLCKANARDRLRLILRRILINRGRYERRDRALSSRI
jgi:hypothetical protein